MTARDAFLRGRLFAAGMVGGSLWPEVVPMSLNPERDLGMVLLGLDSIDALTLDPGRGRIRKPKVSEWSVAEHMHHAALVSGSIATAVRGLLRGRGEDGPPAGELARSILEEGRIPRGVGKAPAVFRPDEHPESRTIQAAVRKSRSRWEGLLMQTDEIEACELRLPHHQLGLMTAAEWVRFAATHTDHHLRIVDNIEDA